MWPINQGKSIKKQTFEQTIRQIHLGTNPYWTENKQNIANHFRKTNISLLNWLMAISLALEVNKLSKKKTLKL